MRFSTIIDEAQRNVVSGTTRMGVGFLVVSALLAVLALADLLTIAGIQNTTERYVASGSATRGLVAAHSVDATACDALASIDTIQSSGAMVSSTALRFSAAPAVSVQTFAASPGFSAVLDITDPVPGGVWMEANLAATLHARVGDIMPTQLGVIQVGGIFAWPQDGRDQRLSFAIVIPRLPSEAFDECWITAWPINDANDILLRSTQLAMSSPGEIGQINTRLGTNYDAYAEFSMRLTRFTPLGALVVGLSVGYALSRLRRLEYASALHAGQTRSAQLLTCAFEALTWSAPSALLLIVIIWAVTAAFSIGETNAVLGIVGRVPLIGAAASILGAMIGCAQVRERNFFRMFKNR
ncbi:MAG: hypothetical protein FWD55_00785 [Propionibacteriaceae bacterium]|nr:hypothetical protein [Propionibacteriaceae bacterium]